MNSKCYICSEQKNDSSSCCKHHIYDKATFMKIKLDSGVKKNSKITVKELSKNSKIQKLQKYWYYCQSSLYVIN